MKELTTTSYAILGLLSVQPWSAYELSKQMKRSMAIPWPRAERAIYDEPKNLVAHQLATARVEANGRRQRTVYTITLAGRRALKRWLSQPPSAPPQFESEALVRATFAEHGTKEALLAAVRSLSGHAQRLRVDGRAVVNSYREGWGPFPERLHLIGLVGRFNLEYMNLLERWSRWAEAEVERWADTTDPGVFPEALEAMEEVLEGDAEPALEPRQEAFLSFRV